MASWGLQLGASFCYLSFSDAVCGSWIWSFWSAWKQINWKSRQNRHGLHKLQCCRCLRVWKETIFTIYSPPNPDDGFFSFAGLLVTQASPPIPRMKRWSLDALVTPRRQRFGEGSTNWAGSFFPAGDSTEGNSRLDLRYIYVDLFNSIHLFWYVIIICYKCVVYVSIYVHLSSSPIYVVVVVLGSW